MLKDLLRLRGWMLLLLVAALTLNANAVNAVAEVDEDEDETELVWVATPTPKSVIGTESTEKKGGGHRLSIPVVDTDFLGMADWTRTQINAAAAHSHATGVGIKVAILDGGFNLDHPDIELAITAGEFDAIDDDGIASDYGNGVDDDGDGYVDNGLGHGTFVAGMVLMAAPDATIIPIRIRDDEGWGTNFELMRGLKYALYAGADIINISGWIDPEDDPQIAEMIALIRADHGIPVIVSAGNDGVTGLTGLSAHADVLPVGAVDKNDVTVDWSNYTTSATMVVAPGNELYGPLGFPLDTDSGYWSGTSFSTGLVSGAAALALDVNGGLSVSQLFNALEDGTDSVKDENGNTVSRLRRIDLSEVVEEVD
ncbi:MAG: S8/S53 family peptidase [Planctomycetota bacterium]|nr:S8/S53 family peptidase [Planctomycetota bacterium]